MTVLLVNSFGVVTWVGILQHWSSLSPIRHTLSIVPHIDVGPVEMEISDRSIWCTSHSADMLNIVSPLTSSMILWTMNIISKLQSLIFPNWPSRIWGTRLARGVKREIKMKKFMVSRIQRVNIKPTVYAIQPTLCVTMLNVIVATLNVTSKLSINSHTTWTKIFVHNYFLS